MTNGPAVRPLTNLEIARLVDTCAVNFNTTTKAREFVAQLERRTVESVTRAHQRYGTSVEQLQAQRELFWERGRKWEAEQKAEGGNKTG